MFASITIGIGFGAGQILITSVGVSAIFIFIAVKGRLRQEKAMRSEFLVSVSWEGKGRVESIVSLISRYCDAVDCIRLENSTTGGSAVLGVNLSNGVVSIDEVSRRLLESLPGSTVSSSTTKSRVRCGSLSEKFDMDYCLAQLPASGRRILPRQYSKEEMNLLFPD